MSAHDLPLIHVTQKHIDEATREHSGKCMIAQAVGDAIPGSTRVHVDIQTIRYTDAKGIRRVFLTGSTPQSALVRYDAGDPVNPFTFRLPQPMHISRTTKGVKGGSERILNEKALRSPARPRVGGRGVPILGNATRRRFGIRNLRINQEGQVVQLGTDE